MSTSDSRISTHQCDPQQTRQNNTLSKHITLFIFYVYFIGVWDMQNNYQTWNLATQLELQKLYSFPSGIVAWYWGKEFRLQKWQIIPKPRREKVYSDYFIK